ncbi:MAG: hypothetical protein RMY29_008280 [Nostoc sp. CreGUA01]|nr:hypothetical protein [Nostoc sp. CreGUA01]
MFNNYLPLPKRKVLLVVAYSLPIILLLWFVISFSVNVPFGDDWDLVGLFGKISSGTANFGDFFAQHNEHRIFFPKIIFTILAFSSKWNIKLEIYFSLLLVLINFFMLYKIAAHSDNTNNNLLFHLFNFITCIINFSLTQYENWLWGFQIAWFLINTCLILAVFILTVPQKLHPNYKLLFASLCCLIASFSSAHGLVSWLVILPLVYLVEGRTKQKKIRMLVWVVLFAFCVAIYFIDYEKPPRHPSILFILQQPLIAYKYFFSLIGFSLGKYIWFPVVTGSIIFFSFLFFNILCLKNSQSVFFKKAAPWLSLGWFAILFALMTTVGRAGFGIEQATSSRYVSVSILLVISCLQLCRLWILCKWQNDKNIHTFSGFCLGFVISILVFNSTNSIAEGQNIFIQRNFGKSCLEVINYLDRSIRNSPNNCLKLLYPKEFRLPRLSRVLEELEFRNFPKNIAFITKTKKDRGFIDGVTSIEQLSNLRRSDSLKIWGWAVLPEAQEQPIIVLLSYGKSRSFFAAGLVHLHRPDVAKVFNSSLYNKSGWEVNVSVKSIPAGENVIKAWVYDQKRQQFKQLNGELKIKVVE